MSGDDSTWFIDDAVDLLGRMASVHLASVSPQGVPLASVAPFVVVDGVLYVYLSGLAAHTANLRATRQGSALIVRDEAECADPFARPRLMLRCESTEEPRDSTLWRRVLDTMAARHGDTASLVRELTDFVLFRLSPHEAQVVSGFARAKTLGAAELESVLEAVRSPRGA